MPDQQQHQYPRPDFQRTNLTWLSLNGPWNFTFDDDDVGESQLWQQSGLPTDHERPRIEVPFTFQTPASKINEQNPHELLWYERTFADIRTASEIGENYRLIIRFGAVDYETTVWLNGAYIGFHRGGHVSFEMDLTDAISSTQQDQRVTIRIRDSPYDLTQPRGKQYWKPQPESIFYTPSSGIWQNVWLESVPPTRIADSSHGTVLRPDDIESGILHANVAVRGRRSKQSLSVSITASIGDVVVCTEQKLLPENVNNVILDIPMLLDGEQLRTLPDRFPNKAEGSAWKVVNGKYLALWSPEHPLLYDIDIKLLDGAEATTDQVHTTAGMRSLSWSNNDNSFRLNDQPYFQALVLDQGYWPDTNITPPSADALKLDIQLSKAMGFNGCRKHQKVEDPLFLYWADRLGFLVWGEMANAYEFSAEYIDRFDAEWKEAVRRDINHPCIVTWTPVNESWGYDDLQGDKKQRDHLRSLYYMTKVLDPTRPVNDNCGWEHVCTDLTTFHEYADGPLLTGICATMQGILDYKGGKPMFLPPLDNDSGTRHRANAPVICTEFGGVNIAPSQGRTGGDRDWGYTTARDSDDLLKRVESLMMGVVKGGLCCGFVYTQLTDIEQEVNGLYTFDRKPKLDPVKVKAIVEKAKAKYFEKLGSRGDATRD